jgi:hypothetical protein
VNLLRLCWPRLNPSEPPANQPQEPVSDHKTDFSSGFNFSFHLGMFH